MNVEKGTPEYEIVRLALDIAAAAPKRQGAHVYAASIPWDLIHELRAAFEEAGIDALAVKAANEYPEGVGPSCPGSGGGPCCFAPDSCGRVGL